VADWQLEAFTAFRLYGIGQYGIRASDMNKSD